MNIFLSLGSTYPARIPFAAMDLGVNANDPVLGKISNGHVQLCPQNGPMKITQEVLADLQSKWPETKFRLHANARLLDKPVLFDLGTIEHFPEYRKALVKTLRYLGEGYSIHAASGKNAPVALKQIERCQQLEQDSGVPVGIEGLYPGVTGVFSTWADYALLLENDVRFAVDLSHLNIVRDKEGQAPEGLVEDLLGHPNCIEVHVSGNNGLRDSHESVEEGTWWLAVMDKINPNAVIFYEGRQRQ